MEVNISMGENSEKDMSVGLVVMGVLHASHAVLNKNGVHAP